MSFSVPPAMEPLAGSPESAFRVSRWKSLVIRTLARATNAPPEASEPQRGAAAGASSSGAAANISVMRVEDPFTGGQDQSRVEGSRRDYPQGFAYGQSLESPAQPRAGLASHASAASGAYAGAGSNAFSYGCDSHSVGASVGSTRSYTVAGETHSFGLAGGYGSHGAPGGVAAAGLRGAAPASAAAGCGGASASVPSEPIASSACGGAFERQQQSQQDRTQSHQQQQQQKQSQQQQNHQQHGHGAGEAVTPKRSDASHTHLHHHTCVVEETVEIRRTTEIVDDTTGSPSTEPEGISYAETSTITSVAEEMLGRPTRCQLAQDIPDQLPHGAATPAEITQQHYLWEQELESVDQKQADLAVLQWKLVRNQAGALARQLADARGQIEDLQQRQRETNVKVKQQDAERETFEQRIKGFVRQLFEKLERGLDKVGQELQTEVQQREREGAELRRGLENLRTELSQAVEKSGVPLEQEVRKLREEFATHQAQVPALRDLVHQHAGELRSGLDQLMDHHCKLKDGLDSEIRDRQQAHGELHTSVKDLVSKERNDRDYHHSKVQSTIGSLQKDMDVHRDEIPALRGRLQEMEDRVQGAGAEHLATLEDRLGEPMQRLQQLERRLEHAQAGLVQESNARQSLAEVFESMLKAEHTKISNLVTQRTSQAQMGCENVVKSLAEKLDKERSDRETQVEAVNAMHARFRAALNERVGGLEGAETKYQAILKELREHEGAQRQLEESLAAALRDTRREILASLADEQAARQAGDQQLTLMVDWIGDHYDRMRDLFVTRGPRKFSMVSASATGGAGAGAVAAAASTHRFHTDARSSMATSRTASPTPSA
eukprot:TRINITY_DN14107_c0_g2_i1.p1 TRINITY_DN14107_c0_g2~~TRINITY_DN14107_c0_g2_i1.p1  ORF type:complete len:835 (+),score=228.85 TRINITY_DN14107_c0_g2_i1:1344-3848(+)